MCCGNLPGAASLGCFLSQQPSTIKSTPSRGETSQAPPHSCWNFGWIDFMKVSSVQPWPLGVRVFSGPECLENIFSKLSSTTYGSSHLSILLLKWALGWGWGCVIQMSPWWLGAPQPQPRYSLICRVGLWSKHCILEKADPLMRGESCTNLWLHE